MRKLICFATVFGMMTLLAVDAEAQIRLPGGGGSLGLLTNKGVQEELKLTDEQKEKIQAKMKDSFPKMIELFGKFKDLPKEEQREKITKAMKEFQDSMEKEVGELLKPEQHTRLKQIARQQDIGRALATDDEVSKAIKLTDEQKEKMKAITEEANKDMRELVKLMRENPKESQEKMDVLRKEVREKTFAVFDDEQKKKWKELTGEPFEVKSELPKFPFPKKDKN